MRAPQASSRMPVGTLARLALADLVHDRLLSLCLALALAAVISPLLIILGLKHGTITAMRARLIQDPRNREIRSLNSASLDAEWFQRMRQQPQVGFAMPATRRIAAMVGAKTAEGPLRDMDLIPTAEGDPLLLENGSSTPGPDEVVLTHRAASELRATAGDILELFVTRTRERKAERTSLKRRVSAVLEQRASAQTAIYAPLPLLEAVEAYRDGLAVPELGGEGSAPVAQPEYDGALVLTAEPLPREQMLQLAVNTGFTQVSVIAPGALRELAGWSEPAAMICWLRNETGTVRVESLAAVREQLRGTKARIIPWIRPVSLEVDGVGPVRVLIAPDGEQAPLQLGTGTTEKAGTRTARFTGKAGELVFPVQMQANPPGKNSLAPESLAGTLRAAMERGVRFDEKSGKFLFERRGYASFRLYARTIDDVDPLRQLLEAKGFRVSTEAERIRDVQELDRQLTRVFLLVGAVGVSGGVASLLASLYASAERKRRELAVLRLLGVARRTLVRFPLYQSLALGGTSYLLSAAAFAFVAHGIEELFAQQLEGLRGLCRLPVSHLAAGLSIALLLSAMSASLAAWRVSRADPADALRDE